MNICPRCASQRICRSDQKYPFERTKCTCLDCGHFQQTPIRYKMNIPGYQPFKRHC